MENAKNKQAAACRTRCEVEYLKCVRETFTGCAEVLRVCRDACRRFHR
jgi:hypothetical protein